MEKVILPKELDNEVKEKLNQYEKETSKKVEVKFILFGEIDNKEKNIIIKDWLFLSHATIKDSSFMLEDSLYDVKKDGNCLKILPKDNLKVKKIEKKHKEKLKLYERIGVLHSHPIRRCELKNKYNECNPSLSCYSDADIRASLLLYVLQSNKRNKKPLIHVLYCQPEDKYLALKFPGKKLIDVIVK